MLNTPAGSPASESNSPKRTADKGTFSDGLRTNVLPQVMATGNIHSGTIDGKLNGVMPTQTPTGCRLVSQSTCGARFSRDWPISKLGMPQANSTISMPRCISARASESVLPCSRVTSAASSSKCSCSNCRKRNITRARSTAGVSLHGGNAAAAAATARSTSAAVPNGTRAWTDPVDGLKTSPQRSVVDGSRRPPIQCGTAVDFPGAAAVDDMREPRP